MSIQLFIEKNFHSSCFHNMELPIFPLNGAVLFPGTSLPLNIFEDRYIDMINYALTKDRCIGMIQTDDKKKLFQIGCIGKIHSFNETSDGRYLISLQGLNCFKVLKELNVNFNFRIVKCELLSNNETVDNKVSINNRKEIILDKYREYINFKNINIDLSEIEKIELDQIVKFIAMVSPFKNIDKQALLESYNFNEFYTKLESIIDLEIAGESINKTLN